MKKVTKKAASRSKSKNPKGEKTIKVLPFQLTAEEKAAKGLEAAKWQQELDAIEADKTAAMKVFNAKIKERHARVCSLLNEIHKGIEEREVECIEFKNFDTNKVEYWHSGQKLKERDMTEDDKQLQFATAKKKTKKFQKIDGGKADSPGGEKEPAMDAAEVSKETTEAVPPAMPTPKKPMSRAEKRRLEIAQVHREETGRNSAYSQLNGPRA